MGGGPEKEANKELLRERGWEVEIGYVSNPSIPGVLKEVPKLTRRLRSDDIDVMVTHCSPPELHAIGYILKKITGEPWLAEFRDPLVTTPDVEPGSFSQFQRRMLEKRVVRSADQIAWWENIQMEEDYFTTIYPEIPKSSFYKIPYLGVGGVDFDKFNRVNAEPYNEFTITYAGSFYEGWIEPYKFLEGLSEFVNRHGSKGIQARFYGDWNNEYQQKVSKENLEDVVTTYDPVPHDEIIQVLKKSHLLLYVGGDDTRNERNISLKMADYVAAESPILGVIDPSFRAGEFIQNENIGISAHPKRADSIADAIKTVYTGNFEYDPADSLKGRFDSRGAMDEYANILNAILKSK
ncbi:hypothetical protein [Halobacteriaceae bacterium SHR40]|uniref:hypothetical protein n=1 Tax=Halovenus amylolytica TaxID=2500550 RepID=UPI000FE32485